MSEKVDVHLKQTLSSSLHAPGIAQVAGGIANDAFDHGSALKEDGLHLRVEPRPLPDMTQRWRAYSPSIGGNHQKRLVVLREGARDSVPFFDPMQESVAGDASAKEEDLGVPVDETPPGRLSRAGRLKAFMPLDEGGRVAAAGRHGVGRMPGAQHPWSLAEKLREEPDARRS